jgi:hypothetical protein
LTDARGTLSGLFGCDRSVQAAPALGIEVTEAVGLEPVGNHPEYQVAGKVSGRWPPENSLPTPAQFSEVEIAQAGNLSLKLISVWQRRTDPNAWHGAQAARRLDALAFLVRSSSASVIR